MEEIWKPVVGYESFYEVSNTGKIKSLRSGKLRKLIPNKQNGYLMLFLNRKESKKCCYVHRLVAEAFCEKPAGNDCVNHKDENKHNNNADNLEWVTKYYNNTYNGKTQRCCKEIEQLNEDGTVVRRWHSAREAYHETGIEYKNISTVCRGLRQRAGGFKWRFVA